jgi:hypothetical protein
LITPAVFQARLSAKNAAIKAEIDMLHMAMMNYKNEYGSFPPAADSVLSMTPLPGSIAAKHIKRLFPRVSDAAVNTQLADGFPLSASPKTLNTTNALSYWLMGFTSNPISPLRPRASRKKMFDFDQSRVDQVTGAYYPAKKPGANYIYIPHTQYVGSIAEIDPVTGLHYNQDTFQILCAGIDEVWLNEDLNNNNVLDLGEDANSNGELDQSDDDLSNFWKGTRGDQ